MPATVALHDTVAVPDPVTLPGVIAPQVRPFGTVSVRLTVPEKWFRAVTVMVDVAETPALTAVGTDVAMLKSWNRNIVAVEWTSEPLVPVTVSV